MAKGRSGSIYFYAQHLADPGLATADDCDAGEEVSRVRLRYPKLLMSCTIALAHSFTLSHTVRCLDRDTAGDCIGRAGLSGLPAFKAFCKTAERDVGFYRCCSDERRVGFMKIPRGDIDGVGEMR